LQIGWSGVCSEVLSDVPQGSVLGPILFVLYINDIDDSLNSKILKFADDTKLYGAVNSVAGIESLRLDMQKLVLWSTEWQMLLNIDKCKVLHLGHNNPEVHYNMETTQLQAVHEERDLGIIVSADLKWENSVFLQLKKLTKYLE